MAHSLPLSAFALVAGRVWRDGMPSQTVRRTVFRNFSGVGRVDKARWKEVWASSLQLSSRQATDLRPFLIDKHSFAER
jgi:hypothetical protein